jgi:rhodanese-related sulfurtransferase
MSSFRLPAELRRILLEALILCALAITVGLSLNFRMVMHAFTGKTVVMPIPASSPPSTSNTSVESLAPLLPDPVELAEIDGLLTAGALLVDARNGDAYAEGHLPTAVSLPLAEVDSHLPEFLSRVPKDRLLITYCNGFGCPDSFDLGVRLLAEGYQRVLVFEGGVPEWSDAGKPLEASR